MPRVAKLINISLQILLTYVTHSNTQYLLMNVTYAQNTKERVRYENIIPSESFPG